MGHKTLIDGVGYDITGGRCLVDGVGYSIQKGRTLVDGVGYDVAFKPNSIPAGELEVGSPVYANVDGVRTEFLVVHQGNPNTSIYDASCDGTWLLMKNIYGTHVYMDAQGVNFNSSNIRSYLNDEFIYLLDDQIVDSIVTAVIPYSIVRSYSYATIKTGSSGSQARIFLLSGTELRLSNLEGVPSKEGAELSYFSSCNRDGADSKRVAYLNGAASTWWTRSVGELTGTRATTFVTKDGSADQRSGSTPYGVRPAFILASNTLVDADTFDIIG